MIGVFFITDCVLSQRASVALFSPHRAAVVCFAAALKKPATLKQVAGSNVPPVGGRSVRQSLSAFSASSL